MVEDQLSPFFRRAEIDIETLVVNESGSYTFDLFVAPKEGSDILTFKIKNQKPLSTIGKMAEKTKTKPEAQEELVKHKPPIRERNLSKCDTRASLAEYLDAYRFDNTYIQRILMHAINGEKPNYTQVQLHLQSLSSPREAYAVLLRLMEINYDLEKLL